MKKYVEAKSVKEGYHMGRGSKIYLVKFVDVGPKLVYIKTLSGKAFSIPVNDKVEVYA